MHTLCDFVGCARCDTGSSLSPSTALPPDETPRSSSARHTPFECPAWNLEKERSLVTIHSVRREVTTTRKSFTLQFFGNPLIFISLPCLNSPSLQSNVSARW